jgi:hypothetical protein
VFITENRIIPVQITVASRTPNPQGQVGQQFPVPTSAAKTIAPFFGLSFYLQSLSSTHAHIGVRKGYHCARRIQGRTTDANGLARRLTNSCPMTDNRKITPPRGTCGVFGARLDFSPKETPDIAERQAIQNTDIFYINPLCV